MANELSWTLIDRFDKVSSSKLELTVNIIKD